MTTNAQLLPAPAADGSEGGTAAAPTSGWRLALRSFGENRLAVIGVGIVVLFVLFCFAGPHFYHTNQTSVNVVNSFQPPGSGHILGTDGQGFDELGRVMLGGQSSLEVGLFAAAIATTIGTLYGTAAGLAGGYIDAIMMRFVDMLLSIPFLFIVLIVATKFSSTVLSLGLILGMFSWLVPARLVRAEVLALRNRGFVAAARVMGSSGPRLAFRHLIPNALGVVVVNITFQIADAIIAVATLGFLGFGLYYPHTDWGDQLSNGVTYLTAGYWWLIFPVGICLILVVMAFNFIGDALRDAVDVRLRRR
jgi:ABC-type dipeptide/oligopeptide/nickel transport system permease subunit